MLRHGYCLVKTGAFVVVLLGIAFLTHSGNAEPVVCQNQPSDLFAVDLNGSANLVLLDGGATIEYNNMGYRSVDEKLYAVEITSTGTTGKIVKMNIDGSGIVLLSTTGVSLDPTKRYDAGDVNNELDLMYISNTGGSTLFTLDLQTLVMTSATITGPLGLVADWAYNPDDNLLYAVDSQGMLAVLDPATAVRTDYAVGGGGMPTGEVFGAAWYDPVTQDIFVYRNTQTGAGNSIYRIDPSTKTRIDQWSAPNTEVNDGAYVPFSQIGEGRGACCGPWSSTACTVAYQSWCVAQGGIYMGDGTVCGGGTCATPVEQGSWGRIKALYK